MHWTMLVLNFSLFRISFSSIFPPVPADICCGALFTESSQPRLLVHTVQTVFMIDGSKRSAGKTAKWQNLQNGSLSRKMPGQCARVKF